MDCKNGRLQIVSHSTTRNVNEKLFAGFGDHWRPCGILANQKFDRVLGNIDRSRGLSLGRGGLYRFQFGWCNCLLYKIPNLQV